ncbi:MAG: hypothetical protein HUK19_07445 [Fibrobacter sp.]|nr:hypothetical protein [Fibrobacter sp.]
MIRRNFPLLLLAMMFIVLGTVLFVKVPQQVPLMVEVEEQEPPEQMQSSFTGRMVMPSMDDLYVLDNSAGRDLLQFLRFLQGRAAGLHWLASSHFRKDVYMGLKLSIDSTGIVTPTILYCNSKDQKFSDLVLQHIRAFWRYPPGTTGKFEVWMPILWRESWK